MSITRILGIWVFVLTATSCSTRQCYLRHNALEGPAAQQQLAADQVMCNAASSVSGVPPPRTTFSSPPGFSSNVQQAQAEAPTQYGLTNVFGECMARRGWSLRPVMR